jgi:ribonuclease BN (tRNA processing enzyme)
MMQAQVRKTGGLFFDLDDVKFILDPGPGALVHAHALDLQPDKWNGILLSHLHVDNSSDVNVLLDGMTNPFLVAEEHCILPKEKLKEKKSDYYPCVTAYHQKLVKELHPVKHGDTAKIGSLEIKAFRAVHTDPAVGFLIKHGKITIGYPADTCYYKGQEKHYEGCDVMIFNILVPKGQKPDMQKHMAVDDAITFIRAMQNKPKLIVMQHLSFWMMRSNLFKQAKILKDATKIEVLVPEDFMELDLGNFSTKILKPKKQE